MNSLFFYFVTKSYNSIHDEDYSYIFQSRFDNSARSFRVCKEGFLENVQGLLLHELSLRDNKILNHIVTVTSSDIYRIIYIYIYRTHEQLQMHV